MENLCLYELDENDEATNVDYFCSETCRQLYFPKRHHDIRFAEGISIDAISGTVCDHCGKELHD